MGEVETKAMNGTATEGGDHATPAEVIRGLGYRFNRAGKLVDLHVPEGPFVFTNQSDYEKLGDAVALEIQRRLRDDLGLVEHRIPHSGGGGGGGGDGSGDNGGGTNFFASPGIGQPSSLEKPIAVFICGSGAVLAGQWARSLCINESLTVGSCIPDVENAQRRGWDVVVMNPNGGRDSHHHSPEGHALAVWDKVVAPSRASSIFILAHSYGGVLTCELLDRVPADMLPRVKAVAMTDSVHSCPSRAAAAYLVGENARNWVTSDLPLDSPVGLRSGVQCVSAGHTKHEWTTYSARRSVWEFFDSFAN